MRDSVLNRSVHGQRKSRDLVSGKVRKQFVRENQLDDHSKKFSKFIRGAIRTAFGRKVKTAFSATNFFVRECEEARTSHRSCKFLSLVQITNLKIAPARRVLSA